MDTGTSIAYGITAPAERLSILDRLWSRWGHEPWSLLGFYSNDVLFFLGVILVWYLVGKRIDSLRAPRNTQTKRWSNLLFLLFGAYLMSFDLLNFGNPVRLPVSNDIGGPVEVVLYFVWAIALIAIPGRELTRALRRKPATLAEGRHYQP
jgi:hypothetical protein